MKIVFVIARVGGFEHCIGFDLLVNNGKKRRE